MKAIDWTGHSLRLLDQTKLPEEIVWVECRTYDEVATAIRQMIVRGAPAIGAAAAYALVLAAQACTSKEAEVCWQELQAAADVLRATRPTAVNLAWALQRMLRAGEGLAAAALAECLETEANTIAEEDVKINRTLGQFGAELVPDGGRVLTHCNAGALATVGYGTALGVIRAAVEQGKRVEVFADETRPYLQGSRLTTFELMQDNIPVTLITDSMAGWLMASGGVDLVIVGADRVARNGDVANKIGTYTLAVLAKEHQIPFYVACPLSTLDLTLATGQEIIIEEREAKEITHIRDIRLAPAGARVWNPAFDVTPHQLVTAFITEKGLIYPPFTPAFERLFQ
ncbi:MAG: S-methyl-5-thioribose-1-phosphate isomerase [Firmicutes bacterium]|nr:S-methyl-5-thioribose-1-phosphate isomerase [Bacillota bacterium]